MTRIHCPHCGHETARIIYGFPVMDDKLQKDIDKQRVYLAGCAKRIPPATRHCFHCDQDRYLQAYEKEKKRDYQSS